LYAAAKNGHLKVIKFFIEEGADPHLTSIIRRKSNKKRIREDESILEAAVRWRYTKVVEYLIQNFNWNRTEI